MSDIELKDKVIRTLKGFNFDIRECTGFEINRQEDKITCMGSFKTSKDTEKVILLDVVYMNELMMFTNLKSI